MKKNRSGVWWISSESDPRWNYDEYWDFVNIFAKPKAYEHKMKELEKKYGKPPADLYYGCMKD